MSRNLKRVLVLFVIAVICMTSVFAVNTQKQYQVSSYEWQTVNKLCIMSGSVGPSNVGPVSGEELLIALDRVDKTLLPEIWQNEYDAIRSDIAEPAALLDVDNFRFNVSPAVGFEIYAQSRNDEWIQNDDWYLKYNDRMALLDIPVELDLFDTLYGVADFSMMPCLRNGNRGSNYNSSYFSSTAEVFTNGSNKTMPMKVGISGGNHYSHFYLGRDRQSIGNGYTGNLMTGDNFAYQEFAKFSFHNKVFTYNWDYTHYDQQRRTPIGGDIWDSTILDNFAWGGNHQVRIVHSYTVTPLKWMSFGLHFGNMIQSDSALDLRMLNPFMFMHNYFNFAAFNFDEQIEANNHFALTFEFVPLRNWQITGQIMVDQFQLAGEVQAGNPPNALGFLLNTTYQIPVSNGVVSPYLEFVYTTPALYLNEKYVDENGDKLSHALDDGQNHYDWNQDLIVGYSLWWGNDLSYVGYQYGPDSLVASLGFNYTIPRILNLDCFALFKMHGQHGIGWHGNQDPTVPKVDDPWDIWLSGNIEYMLQLTADATYSVTDWCDIRSSLTYIHRFNNRNVVGENWNDVQFTLGCSMRYSK